MTLTTARIPLDAGVPPADAVLSESPHPQTRWRLIMMASHLLENDLLISKVRVALYRRVLGARLGANTVVEPGVRITTPRRLVTGECVFVNAGSVLDSSGWIVLEDRVALGPRVTLVTTTHAIGGPDERAGRRIHQPIRIGRGCWIGANATVRPGVRIGAGCIIGAGSVVTKDCEPNGLYVGNPAHRVRDLPLQDPGDAEPLQP